MRSLNLHLDDLVGRELTKSKNICTQAKNVCKQELRSKPDNVLFNI